MSKNVQDSPEATLQALFDRADEIFKNSKRGRPKKGENYQSKVGTKVRLEKHVLDWLKAAGPEHNTRINAFLLALKEAEEEHLPDRVMQAKGFDPDRDWLLPPEGGC